MAYDEISSEEREAAIRIAEKELAAQLNVPQEDLTLNVERVIRTLWRYKVKGTLYVRNMRGWLSQDNSPAFQVVLNADSGLPGDYQVTGLSINH